MNKILFIGDSLVQGYGVSKDENWVSLVSKELKEFQCINEGYNGMTSSQVLKHLKGLLKEQEFVLVAVLCGANDFIQNISVDMVRKNLEEIRNLIKNHGSTDILILPSTPAFESDSSFVSMASFVSLKEKILDLNKIYENEAILLSRYFDKKDDLFFDGVHPTEEGHRIIADIFLQFLKQSN